MSRIVRGDLLAGGRIEPVNPVNSGGIMGGRPGRRIQAMLSAIFTGYRSRGRRDESASVWCTDSPTPANR